MLTTSGDLYINATVTEAVDSVRFTASQILLNITNSAWDEDMSDGADVYLSPPSGLHTVVAYAYDADGNMIDSDTVPYLVLFNRGSSGGG